MQFPTADRWLWRGIDRWCSLRELFCLSHEMPGYCFLCLSMPSMIDQLFRKFNSIYCQFTTIEQLNAVFHTHTHTSIHTCTHTHTMSFPGNAQVSIEWTVNAESSLVWRHSLRYFSLNRPINEFLSKWMITLSLFTDTLTQHTQTVAHASAAVNFPVFLWQKF